MGIEYIKIAEEAVFQKGRGDDAGYDMVSTENATLIPGQSRLIGTGIKVSLPQGYMGILTHRSSLPSKGVGEVIMGIVDSGYHGEVYANVKDFSNYYGLDIKKGQRFCQMVVVPIYTGETNEVREFSRESERGEESSSKEDKV